MPPRHRSARIPEPPDQASPAVSAPVDAQRREVVAQTLAIAVPRFPAAPRGPGPDGGACVMGCPVCENDNKVPAFVEAGCGGAGEPPGSGSCRVAWRVAALPVTIILNLLYGRKIGSRTGSFVAASRDYDRHHRLWNG